jgi:LCP family protein required for cell wall assembly
VVSAIVLVVSIGGWATYSYLNGNVKHVALKLGGGASTPRNVENFLLVGTDSRAGSGNAYGNVPGQRSDTTILVHLAGDGTTTMVSFPRDTFVTIPAYTDSAGRHHAAHKDKFNAAISDGGPQLLVSLVESLTGITVDHYLAMDLEGFKSITDAIGGVEVCVLPSNYREWVGEDQKYSTNSNDPMSGWLGGPGIVHVNGTQALAFVRTRHGLVNGDLGRIQRQQQFIRAVVKKATTSDTLTNPVKLAGLMNAATSALTLDNNTSIADLKALALQLKGMGSGTLHMETLPVHPPTAAEGGIGDTGQLPVYGAVEIYNPVDLAELVDPLGGDVPGVVLTPSPAPTPQLPVTVPASQVSLTVYNGSGTRLLAKAVAALSAKGFTVTSGGNADSQSYTTSRVLYGSGEQAAARTVQAAVPGSELRADPTVTGIHLILGSSYSGVVTPGAAASSTAAPAVAPAPSSANPAYPAGCTY